MAKKQTLAELGLSASTYYRWQRRYRQQGEAGLVDRRPQPGTMMNISGHKTESVFNRYHIVETAEISEALIRAGKHDAL